jgi:hypothetical protein
MHLGYNKHCSFICKWDSRTRVSQDTKTDWPTRKTIQPGVKNVLNEPLGNPKKVLLPPLYKIRSHEKLYEENELRG